MTSKEKDHTGSVENFKIEKILGCGCMGHVRGEKSQDGKKLRE